MEKLYYSIGEVADVLGENVSLVRFWSDSFPKFIKPKRNAKGNRMFTKEDLDTSKKIHLTLEGAAKKLQSGTSGVDNTVKVLEYLRSLKDQLKEIHKSL